MDIQRAGPTPPQEGPAEWFTGSVRLDPLFQACAPAWTEHVRDARYRR